MTTHPINRLTDRLRLASVADWLAVATAASLPWSTSLTSIFLALFLLALLPTLDLVALRREVLTPAGGLPVLLVLFGALGTLEADVAWLERWKGLESFLRLLLIPLLFVHFRRSDRGMCVLAAYLISCIVLLPVTSLIHTPTKVEAVFVKNAATQSGEFVACIFGLLYLAVGWVEGRRWLWAGAAVAVVLGMLANMAFIATGRTALVVFPVLLVLFAAKKLSAKGMVALFACAVAVSAFAWFSSPYLRDRTTQLWTDYKTYEQTQALTSSGQRVVFYETSVKLIRQAPIFGHGTGSIAALFDREVANKTITDNYRAANPHNQTFAVAIQIGLVGAAVLWAMWVAHLSLFRGPGLAAWIGLLVVVQNIVGSLFNSHLFDFDQGWVYILGVGVAGGMVLKERAAKV